MKILLIGASGMIGQRVLAEAVRRKHAVTTVTRNPAKVAPQPGVTPVKGDALDPLSIAALARGHDAVISAFKPDPESKLIDATRALIAGLTTAGVKRLVMVGGAASLEVSPGLQLVDTPMLAAEWRPIALAHRDALAVLRQEADALEWTSLSPAAFIQPGERTGRFRLGRDQLLVGADGQSRISAEDYAVALLDEVEFPKYVRMRFSVAY